MTNFLIVYMFQQDLYAIFSTSDMDTTIMDTK